MAGLVRVDWYATVLRQESFAEKVAAIAPLALRYGATQYAVHRSLEDRYKIAQMAWFESKTDWYRYWDGPEMIDFRTDNWGHFQIPIAYSWHEELAVGRLAVEPEAQPAPQIPA
jgi:hypothetical protein